MAPAFPFAPFWGYKNKWANKSRHPHLVHIQSYLQKRYNMLFYPRMAPTRYRSFWKRFHHVCQAISSVTCQHTNDRDEGEKHLKHAVNSTENESSFWRIITLQLWHNLWWVFVNMLDKIVYFWLKFIANYVPHVAFGSSTILERNIKWCSGSTCSRKHRFAMKVIQWHLLFCSLG